MITPQIEVGSKGGGYGSGIAVSLPIWFRPGTENIVEFEKVHDPLPAITEQAVEAIGEPGERCAALRIAVGQGF